MLRNFFLGLTKALPSLMPLFANLKSYIFADGKFNLQRSLVLLLCLVLLIFATRYVAVGDLQIIIEMLDEISDILGYS